MSASVKKNLSLTNGKTQLVDLNGGSINFDIAFTAKSLDNSQFNAIVATQTTLDSGTPLNFQTAMSGTISAHIVSDKNVYDNYYLCLKADKNCDIEVLITKKEIAAKVPQPHESPRSNLNSSSTLQMKAPPPLKPPSKPSKTNWSLICIVILIIGGFGFYYYYYIYKKKKITTTIELPTEIDTKYTLNTSPLISSPFITSPSLLSEFNSSKITQKSSLSERLTNLLESS